jgi:hypothetical protein
MFKHVVLFGVLVALAVSGTCLAHSNANGIGYFALQVPNPTAMKIDGRDDDWTWYDPAYIVTPEEMFEIITGEMPPKSDIDLIILTGWTPPPDNRLYGFVKVTDDTLHIAQVELDNGWLDDDLEVITDADHSGGPFRAEGVVTDINAQQFTFHLTTSGYSQFAWLRYQAPPESQWSTAEIEAAFTTSPAGAANGATNVVVNYEYRMPLWVEVQPAGKSASPRQDLSASQTIGLTYQLNEADTGDRTHQLATAGANGAAWDASFSSDYTLLAVGEYTTAVASDTWGRIKATFKP